MSIMTNHYIDMDAGKSIPQRQLFKSTAKWDDTYGRVQLEKESVLDAGRRAGAGGTDGGGQEQTCQGSG
jgi:histone deacetylase 1/2